MASPLLIHTRAPTHPSTGLRLRLFYLHEQPQRSQIIAQAAAAAAAAAGLLSPLATASGAASCVDAGPAAVLATCSRMGYGRQPSSSGSAGSPAVGDGGDGDGGADDGGSSTRSSLDRDQGPVVRLGLLGCGACLN